MGLTFKVGMPINNKNYGLNENGTLTIEGVASTTSKDLQEEIVSPSAIESLRKQVVNRNLHLDHNHDYMGGIGVVDDAYVKDNQLHIRATILPEFAKGIKERLDLGMNFGLSIAGIPIRSRSNPKLIEDYQLLEVSLTLLPANWDTYGTVESKGIVFGGCLTGVCNHIIKKEYGEDDTMDDDNIEQLVKETVEEVMNEEDKTNADNSSEDSGVFVEGVAVSPEVLEQIELPKELTLKQVNEFVDDKINKAFADKETALKACVVDEVEKAMAGDLKEELTTTLKEYVDECNKATQPVEEKAEATSTGEETTEEETDTTGETPAEENNNADDKIEEVVEKSLKEIFRKLDMNRTNKDTKFKSATTSSFKSGKKSFLGTVERDQFGRNKKYL